MNRILLAIASPLIVLAWPGMAHADTLDGDGGMMRWWGHGWWMPGPIGLLVWLAIAAVIVVLIAKAFSSGSATNADGAGEVGDSALNVLKERYARGEIDDAEYDRRRNKLAS